MTEPLAEFKIKVWPDQVHPDTGPFYELLVKKRFAFATFYKRVSFVLHLEDIPVAIKNYKDLEHPRV